MLQAGRPRVRDTMRWFFFSIYLILPAALGPRVHSASNRNDYQKQKKMFLEIKVGPCVGLTTLPPAVSRLSRQCGILNTSQAYRPPRPVTGIALLYISDNELSKLNFYSGLSNFHYFISKHMLSSCVVRLCSHQSADFIEIWQEYRVNCFVLSSLNVSSDVYMVSMESFRLRAIQMTFNLTLWDFLLLLLRPSSENIHLLLRLSLQKHGRPAKSKCASCGDSNLHLRLRIRPFSGPALVFLVQSPLGFALFWESQRELTTCLAFPSCSLYNLSFLQADYSADLLYVNFLLDLLFDPEDCGDILLQNVELILTDYRALFSRRQLFIIIPLRTSNPT
jgi:hypothetical protein